MPCAPAPIAPAGSSARVRSAATRLRSASALVGTPFAYASTRALASPPHASTIVLSRATAASKSRTASRLEAASLREPQSTRACALRYRS